ncbi:hypothetical protein GPY51_10800 [Photorhabdus laumondii subsp. laumondii]|uniref:Uncharacterized protein n=1 Tax=Photorhabdus laumondii subsp. laumondii TaxID=141679 RepID=A0A6L9JS74_PHOLM|nr:hypothetical protein [Photorhabdus laumondii subsp. laumondii]NDL21275.1 hypothetical protein [Photorhabdus laumondii subsp. laumondii]NDL30229.1 hypothetical protein [Photorhabdus laumondii subsp. laumondii]NDL34873.1 hypothetical protein [Photorhabdus laumondii subsp. laumondii]NDL39242.1 hypothetical protein [Photorhabdus laumondii subsp. laumondii]
MGCRGSEVQILSCRPNFPRKTNLLGLVFLWLGFSWCKTPLAQLHSFGHLRPLNIRRL